MKPGVRAIAAAALAAILAAAAATAAPAPPPTPMHVVRDTLHGTVIADPYRWLEDAASPETRAWLEEQSRYYETVMREAPGAERIGKRLAELRATDDVGLPKVRAGRLFYLKRDTQQPFQAITLRDGPEGPEQVLLDPMVLDPGAGTAVRMLDVSEDGRLVAVGIQKGGEDEVEVAILEVATRKLRPGRLPRARYSSVLFSGDAKSLYYARFGADGPRLFQHRLGTDPAKDPMLFGERLGRGQILQVSLSDDAAWMLLSVRHGSAGDHVELYTRDLRRNGPITPVVTDVAASFDGKIGADTLFVRTNWDAPRGRILAISLRDPAREKWREVLAERGNPIESWGLSDGRIVVTYSINVVGQVYLLHSTGRLIGQVPMSDLGSFRGPAGRWSDSEAYFTFESYNVPRRILRLRTAVNEVSTWWQSSAPFRGEDYRVLQVTYASKDGRRIPMFLAYRRDVPRDGTAPVFLTGYGGFNQNRTPRFSPLAAAWMENGGIWAEPALRGGGEFGEDWHRDGMLDRKQNTFDDFIAAAEFLVARRFASPERVAIAGGSNGGLLVGAAMTQRPELFRAVVCSVPLLDMLRYHQFLVARFWVPEYGSSEDPEQFQTLHAYSPYHRVRVGGHYPAVLMVSGDSDTRVDPLHARKMTALLQSANASEHPVILRYDTRSGHSGGKPRNRQVEDDAATLRFLFWQLGIEARDGEPPALPPERKIREDQEGLP